METLLWRRVLRSVGAPLPRNCLKSSSLRSRRRIRDGPPLVQRLQIVFSCLVADARDSQVRVAKRPLSTRANSLALQTTGPSHGTHSLPRQPFANPGTRASSWDKGASAAPGNLGDPDSVSVGRARAGTCPVQSRGESIVARTPGAGMFKAYRVRLPALIAFLATALMPVVLHSAVGSGGTSGKILSILGTWTGTWTNANNITTGTESFVVQTQVGSTITGFFCWDITQDPATCSSNINDYEPWSGTIDATGTLVITGQLGDYPAKLSLDGTTISGTYQNRRIASHTGTWGVQRAPLR